MKKILLDECLPRKLANEITGYEVETVPQCGWASIKNGALIKLAESVFDVLITVDRGIEHQQNLKSTKLAFIVLHAKSNNIGFLLPLAPQILERLKTINAGEVVHVSLAS